MDNDEGGRPNGSYVHGGRRQPKLVHAGKKMSNKINLRPKHAAQRWQELSEDDDDMADARENDMTRIRSKLRMQRPGAQKDFELVASGNDDLQLPAGHAIGHPEDLGFDDLELASTPKMGSEPLISESTPPAMPPATAATPAAQATLPSAPAAAPLGWKAWLSLVVFVVQNACGTMLVRYTKTFAVQEYNSEAAVLMQELAVKLPLSLCLFAIECGGPWSMAKALAHDLYTHRMEWVKMTVPAIIYTVQMALLYVGLENVSAAIGQVTYQTKILFTALCSVLLLKRQLSPNQWLALLILMIGVVCVQDLTGSKKQLGKSGQQPILGLAAFLVAALCSAFASVYLEKMLKSGRAPSLWLRNIQLAVHGTWVAACIIRFRRDPRIATDGLFYGMNGLIWFSIFWQASGGLIVALTIKYAGNLLRCFAQAGAIILVAVTSHSMFGFAIGPLFGVGSVLVMAAIFLYGEQAKTPRELCSGEALRSRKARCAFAAVLAAIMTSIIMVATPATAYLVGNSTHFPALPRLERQPTLPPFVPPLPSPQPAPPPRPLTTSLPAPSPQPQPAPPLPQPASPPPQPPAVWHLAPSGSVSCDHGRSASLAECAAAGELLRAQSGLFTARDIQVQPEGIEPICGDLGWGDVPVGCSIQHGGSAHPTQGDGATHFKPTSQLCSTVGAYKLVCTGSQPSMPPLPTPPPVLPPYLPVAPQVDGELMRAQADDCWDQCGHAGEQCDWCGRGTACCRSGGFGMDAPRCAFGWLGRPDHHTCVLAQQAELVIAVCTEDLAWVDAYAHRFDLVTVYDKCSHTREGPLYAFSSGNVIVRTIPNVGSFDNAALTYIIDRWETLPDTVEFAKGKLLDEGVAKAPLACPDRNHGCIWPPYAWGPEETDANGECGYFDFALDEWSFTFNQGVHKSYHQSGFQNMGSWIDQAAEHTPLSRQVYRDSCCTAVYGGHFAVTREQIRNEGYFHGRAHEIYAYFLSQQHYAAEEVDHFIERTWRSIFCAQA